LTTVADESDAGYRTAIIEILAIFDDDLQMTEEILAAAAAGQDTAESAALVKVREIGRRVLDGRGTATGDAQGSHAGTAAALVLIDCRCGHPRCDEQGVYRMAGHCTNCGRTGLIGLFTAGHQVANGVLGRGQCPSCGNQTCYWDRLATPDEVPEGGPGVV